MFDYVFYSLYKFILITPSKEELPGHTASLLLALVLAFNVVLLNEILLKYDVVFLDKLMENNVFYMGIFVVSLVLCLAVYVLHKKYLKIAEKYDQESKRQKIIKMSLAWLYIIGSFVLLAII